MRRVLAVALLAAVVAPSSAASEPYVTLLDWVEGEFVVGAPVDVEGLDSVRFAFTPDLCHARLLVDLLFSPDDVTVAVPDVGEVEVPFEFQAEVHGPSGLVGSSTIRDSGYGRVVGTVEELGEHELRLFFARGADVSWQLRLRAREVPGPACEPRVVVSEIEANPPGPDAGFEWIELLNLDPEPVDLSAWRIETTHGVTANLTLKDGVVLAPGERLVVEFSGGQFLDNDNESVTLTTAFGFLVDATQPRSDVANDLGTWQRLDDGGWAFLAETPGGPP